MPDRSILKKEKRHDIVYDEDEIRIDNHTKVYLSPSASLRKSSHLH